MKYYLFIFISLIIYSSESNAQYFDVSNKKYYKEKIEADSKYIKASAHTTIEKTKDKSYIYKMYYTENKMITLLKTSKNSRFKKLDGPFMEAYDDGTVVTKGNYVDNVKDGYWIEDVSRSGFYKNGNKEGTWKEYSRDSVLLYEWNYRQGQLDGSVIQYDSLGNVTHQSEYKNGEATSNTMVVKEELPRLPGCEGQGLDAEALKECAEMKLVEAIYYNLKYPLAAKVNGIQGQAKFQFVVTKSGDIADLKVLNGLCTEIKYECLRVISKLPKWVPGTQNGVPVDVVYTLPINFRVERN